MSEIRPIGQPHVSTWGIPRHLPPSKVGDLRDITKTKHKEELTKKFYKIGDVAELLQLPQSTIRFWEKEFSELRPRRNSGGTRRYAPADIEQLRIIRFLIRDKGLTIDGAREHLRRNRRDLERKHEVVKRLKDIRRRLTDLLDALDNRQRELRSSAD